VGYAVHLSPAVPPANVLVEGTAAIVRGLSNGTAYTLSVAAINSAGQGPASTPVQATPSAVDSSAYTELFVKGDHSPTGIFDPALLKSSDGKVWLTYSSVNYYNNASGRVQAVLTRLAESQDGGETFTYLKTLGPDQPATVTDPSEGAKLCGHPTCAGRWAYEVSWVVEDKTDPEASRRFKVFAHKYFLNPPGPGLTQYALGAIVMWTASAPDGTWSAETTVLRWNLTPPEISGGQNVNSIDPALAPCQFMSEGGVSVYGNGLDMGLSCFYTEPPRNSRAKVVLLRTTDHAQSFQYVSTPLTLADATALGKEFFTASSLLPTPGNAPALIASTWKKGVYEGCYIYPFASEQAGTLFRENGSPIAILKLPERQDLLGGACGWDRGIKATGVLMGEVGLTKLRNGYAFPFKILETKRAF
jgi:hypothetical protein